MSTGHSKAAKQFLKNQQYAHWHDATFWAVRTKRDNMAHGLEEWAPVDFKVVRPSYGVIVYVHCLWNFL